MKPKKEYPEIIQIIHKEFNTASDSLLKEVNEVLSKSRIEKSQLLNTLGFTQAQEARDLTKLKADNDLLSLITHYSICYPNNKFITHNQVMSICKKYNLVCGPVSSYTGFIPNENLIQIKEFKVNDSDLPPDEVIITKGWGVRMNRLGGPDFEKNAKRLHKAIGMSSIPITDSRLERMFGKEITSFNRTFVVNEYEVVDKSALLICAPPQNMNVKGIRLLDGIFSITKKHIPDPVALKPVNRGYLVVTAWGDEASDEDVVNQKMN